MSGGSLNYWNANEPIEEIEKRYRFGKGKYTPETLEVMKETLRILHLAEIYTHRLEWMLSGDDSEESLHKRLKEDLETLKEEPEPQEAKCEMCKYFEGKCEFEHEMDATECWDFEGVVEDD